MKTAVILGGGISGLSTAYYLTKFAKLPLQRLILLESSSRVGGCIKTEAFEDGAIFEQGPRSIRANGIRGYNALEMTEDIGLTSSILSVNREHPATKNRYIYVKGQMCPLPSGPASILKRQPPFSKSLLALGWKEPFRSRKIVEDESVDSFFRRRFGDEVAQYAIDPLCRGIYSGNSRQLSMRACFPQLLAWEQKYGSIVMGALRSKKEKAAPVTSELVRRYKAEHWSMWSLQSGLAQLTDTLRDHLVTQGVEIHQGAPCTAIRLHKDSAVLSWGNEEVEVDYVFSTIPSKDLAPLVSAQHSTLCSLLGRIPFTSVAVANLQYNGQLFSKQAFGHLIPSSEPSKAIGVLYDSCIFPDHNGSVSPTTKITCMMGGAWFKELFGDEDEADPDMLTQLAVETVREQLNITETPFRAFTTIRKRSIPQYVVGHTKLIDDIWSYVDSRRLPLSLIGASYKGVSINDCIHNARVEVDRVLGTQPTDDGM